MDIDLLSKMVGELILEHDEVCLPGVGTFVADYVGAGFSDKGFVVNPPYRKLSFRNREGDPGLLLDFYSSSNGISRKEAEDILTSFLKEMKEVLSKKKVIIFPGLGRLRATKENIFFFVPDEDLNIYPEGFGLDSVSLKRHGEDLPEELVEEARKITPASEPIPEPEPAPKPAPRKRMPAWAAALVTVVAAAALMLGALAVVGRVAPELADKILYTKEEREILYR